MKEKANTKSGGKVILAVLVVLFIIGGLTMALYPTISNYLAEKNGSEAISGYQAEVETFSKEYCDYEFKKAEAYNKTYTGSTVLDPYSQTNSSVNYTYFNVLNVGDGAMGYINIPSIKTSLIIYHGTSDGVLSKGVGHIETTALPIGGKGNHSVLTGHTGLSTAKLFTDLDKMEIGDVFYIHVLNRTLCYKVDEINVVLPDDLSKLQPVPTKDYVTLLTCTPYGINSHRLLVRGVRIDNESGYESMYDNITAPTPIYKKPMFIGACVGLAVLIIVVIIVLIAKRHKRKEEDQW